MNQNLPGCSTKETLVHHSVALSPPSNSIERDKPPGCSLQQHKTLTFSLPSFPIKPRSRTVAMNWPMASIATCISTPQTIIKFVEASLFFYCAVVLFFTTISRIFKNWSNSFAQAVLPCNNAPRVY